MQRADRRDSNDDNENKYPRSRREEPISPHELKKVNMTLRSRLDETSTERDQLKQSAQENQEAATQLVHVQQEFQTFQVEAYEWKENATQNHQLYLAEQNNYQQTLILYNEERTRATELLAKYNEVDTERSKYLSLYNEAQLELKYERKSKAGVKGWETRRKRENQLLKQEIAEMTLLVRESLVRKDEAVDNLYALADRMDRIQRLVDSVEEGTSSTPVGLLQKLKRVWLAVKEILGE
jgi:hypothetical protein